MDAECSNEHMLEAIRHLSYIQDGKTRYPVNWKNVGADELGSIYESLLELHPRLNRSAGTFELDSAAGHERKTTGSYYTPSSLVDCLLDSALDPVLDEAARKKNPEEAILDLKICDPACGSGHFLVAAARRTAKRLASVRSGDSEPSPREVQKALRDVVGHCIYGVDINPMAVELCKVSLWMEAIEPGKPLSFLDSHIQCGNSLLGTTPALMSRGIPTDAFKPIEGDDKKVATRLKAKNRKAIKDEKAGQHSWFDLFDSQASSTSEVKTKAAVVENTTDETIEGVRRKEQRWEKYSRSDILKNATFKANAWCSAFVWPKKPGDDEKAAITHNIWRQIQKDITSALPGTRRTVRKLTEEYRFFHWHLAFPQVFEGEKSKFDKEETTGWLGGFDVILGNPPWERIKLQEKEFFTTRHKKIANAPKAATRKKLINKLQEEDPELWNAWQKALRLAAGKSLFVRSSSRYPLCGRGDINTYSIFAEQNRNLLSSSGQAGFIVPGGIATDSTTQHFFSSLINSNELISLFHFENEEFIFPTVHHAFRFTLLTISKNRKSNRADFVFYARGVTDLSEEDRHFTLASKDFENLNPNTLTCPTFRWKRDAEITKEIYRKVPVLWKENDPEGNPWQLSFNRMLDMANDSNLFHTRVELENVGWKLQGNIFTKDKARMLPLYEAKMVHHYDHRFGTYEGQTKAQSRQGKCPEFTTEDHESPNHVSIPRYWINEEEINDRLKNKWEKDWLIGWRDVTGATVFRSCIASTIPKSGVADTFLLALSNNKNKFLPLLTAQWSSFVLDYCARQKIGGVHLKYNVFKQLPCLPPQVFQQKSPWNTNEPTIAKFLIPRILELTYTSWDLEAFAQDNNYNNPPLKWIENRRFLLRCELDAVFFHLFLVSKKIWNTLNNPILLKYFARPNNVVDYIMETFPIVKRREIKAHGEYRTKIKILEIYDTMQKAIDTGEPYKTVLDPPPADPSLCHPESTRPEWAKKDS